MWKGLRFLVLGGLISGCAKKVHSSYRALSKEDSLTQAVDSFLLESLAESSVDTLLRPFKARGQKGSAPIDWQLIHTELSLSLDWVHREVPGEALLTLKPYFWPQKTLTLDAKAFQIEEVKLMRPAGGRIVAVHYDSLKLTLELDRFYSGQETLVVYIRYRAQPERLGESQSVAISGRKGAYFINPDGKRPCVPRQFWTQGEPESASAWFPTLDSPNQKTTQRLCITVEDTLVTLSNGLRVWQEKLPGGLRRDCWELRQPHAPYLFALVVGPFRVVQDTWRGKEVSYYLEPGWESQARAIFGRTPQMLEFFSRRLGVDFPWPKYSQVVVREFVSGAMENTTAVVHGDMLLYDRDQALTEDQEHVVAHELFHHWFGDLVTCESWGQLPLNESFADYAEYLWLEYSRGVEAAEAHRQEAYSTYLAEAREKKVPLIRLDYSEPMEMFDAHSYQKGGLTLHLLRNMVGDSAFFLSLRQYLLDQAYGTADIDHLRHAFEKVTGRDWTWFFDQHFRRSDEVRFLIEGQQREDTARIRLLQRGYDTLQGPYRYITQVALFSAQGYEELPLEVVGDTVFTIVRAGLRAVDVDPRRLFIGEVHRSYPRRWWPVILQEGRYFWARTQALREVQPFLSEDSALLMGLRAAYGQGGPYWRKEVWEALELLADSEAVRQVLPWAREAIRDSSALVRAAAWSFLVQAGQQELLSLQVWKADLQAALQDSSRSVRQTALMGLFSVDSVAAQDTARRWLQTRTNPEDVLWVSLLLLMEAQDTLALSALMERYPCLVSTHSRILALRGLVLAYAMLPSRRAELRALFAEAARTENPWYVRLILVQNLRLRLAQDPEIAQLLRQIKAEETHPLLRKYYDQLL